ncbi:MAG: 3-hydroxyacyl-CoA dehydrogenase [Micavibrio aeruginosavorus]|uniref:3-hydroxyacyl-CoA dehydrogenase n=1 Tax=Micavibrio aeruginosavorus TaxID=349221 RepID=A0A7T5R1N4_9BACT|nr:MAG: 3-hydroxyacyl-CoA dehydrogenase [Micavibrio aeruginosavorus]
MSDNIRKAVVIGAGTMGARIAAHLANAGVRVHLLDRLPDNPLDDRNKRAKDVVERMAKADPQKEPLDAGFMTAANARLVVPGNTEDHFESAVADADWVIEAVFENLDLKRSIFEKIDKVRKPHAVVSSNTSTIRLEKLVEGRSQEFKENFLITHFFNPPRAQKLLELVRGEETSDRAMEAIREFGDKKLGKTVLECKDTTGFIGNRIGIYWLVRSMVETMRTGTPVENVDAVIGAPLGMPRTGVYGLLDLVGIGLVPGLMSSIEGALPVDDPLRQMDYKPTMLLIDRMLKEGRTGRFASNGAGGFYRMQTGESGAKTRQGLDLQSGEYRVVGKPRLQAGRAGKGGENPRAVFEAADGSGQLAWVVMRDTILYAVSLVPEIADDIADIDIAMRAGYSWKYGPFEMIDRMGGEWFAERLKAEGIDMPPVLEMAQGRPFYRDHEGHRERLVCDFKAQTASYRPMPQKDGVLRLSDIKRSQKPVLRNDSASVWDIGDGVLCFEFHSKMNTMDPSILHLLNSTIHTISASKGGYKALVVYNEGENFSLGANLGLVSKGFDLAAGGKPFAKIHEMLLPLMIGGLKKLNVPKGAATALHNAIKPLFGALDKVSGGTASGKLEEKLCNFVSDLVWEGQAVYRALREAPFPVVGAPQGAALGGGCEILLHCSKVQASAETYMALVESGVGLIPGWGGVSRMLERAYQAQAEGKLSPGVVPPIEQTFMNLLIPAPSVSAQDAVRKMWMRPEDGITMNPERLLYDAKQAALSLVPGYQPPKPAVFRLPGASVEQSLLMGTDMFYASGLATWHDVNVAGAMAHSLSGGDTHIGETVTESELEHLVRQNFISLIKTEQTRARIAFTLANGKPLRESSIDKSLDDIRALRQSVDIPYRPINGLPLTGIAEERLARHAQMTSRLMKMFSPD